MPATALPARPIIATDLDIVAGDQLQDHRGKWRTVVSVTDARPGRV